MSRAAVGTLNVGGLAQHDLFKFRFTVAASVLEDRHEAIIHQYGERISQRTFEYPISPRFLCADLAVFTATGSYFYPQGEIHCGRYPILPPPNLPL